ncbi:MAG: TrkH family potassium uptake protein [Planctomycetota bacterium]
MRIRFVTKQLGIFLILLAASMLPSALWAVYDHYVRQIPDEQDTLAAISIAILIGTVMGAIMLLAGRTEKKQFGRKEAMLLVALCWVVGAALAAAPYRIWAATHQFTQSQDQAFSQYVNCYFEAISGLTTTGASTLSNIESIPRALLFWRAFTHWIGGLGIIVLFVAVLPILGVGGKRLFKFETPGPSKEGIRPRIRAAAQVLWLIYLGITLAEILMLKVAGIAWFDSITHAFATMATGGFSTQNASITGLGSWKVELIIIWFMFMAGVNFGLYDRLLAGRWREVMRNPEFRAYVTIMIVAFIIITCLILNQGIVDMENQNQIGLWSKIRHSLFATVAIQTTTGFCTADFDQWAFPAKVVLVILMFVGGCGGSTGGGIKVIRFVILAKVLWAEMEATFRPNVVRTVRVGQSTIDPQMRSATLVYFMLIGIVTIIATIMVIWIETPQKLDNLTDSSNAAITAFSAVAATINNIGPGLNLVGPAHNYCFFTQPTKIILCVLMALGRLELYAFLVLIMPRFWKEE